MLYKQDCKFYHETENNEDTPYKSFNHKPLQLSELLLYVMHIRTHPNHIEVRISTKMRGLV